MNYRRKILSASILASLCLAAKAKQDEVVLRKQRSDELRHHRVVVADDAGEQRTPAAQRLDQVLANLLPHCPVRHLAPLDGLTQYT